MKYFCTLIWSVLGILALQLQAVGEGFVNSFIPEDLVENANAVVRSEEIMFTVNSISSGTKNHKATITILNEGGKDKAMLRVYYNKLVKVDFINATTYDRSGKKVKTLRKKDIVDVSAISDGNLFVDHRVQIGNMTHTVYPYTVEYEYQTTTSNMLFYPTWVPLDESNLSIAKSTFKVLVPKELQLRYREKNLPAPVAKEATATHDVYTWQVENLAPHDPEPFSPSAIELIPQVQTAPVAFEVEGYQGNMQTWKNYGVWINKLNEGRDVLPEATKQKLQVLTADAKTQEEKVRKVYDYLQANTRYVSIQLGIGGWQPFEASFVDSKGYGDCKALTNYMQAMLKAVGISSLQALVRAGEDEDDVIADFPSSQFNHVVLCVPTPQDSLWLECTSQTNAAGYAGTFTGNRHALLITPEGGKLVKTPAYTAKDNTQQRSIAVKLDEKGNGTAQVTTVFKGAQQESRSRMLHHMKPEEQKKWLYNQIKIPSFEISSFAWKEDKNVLPSITEDLKLNLRQCVTLSGKRMFLAPNLMNKWTYTPPLKEDRKTEVVINSRGWLDIDTVSFTLPSGYALEFVPQDVTYTSEFGKYSATAKVDGQQVTYIRTMQLNGGRFAPEAYAKLVEFFNNVLKADDQKIVFVKQVP